MSPTPTFLHQTILGRLYVLFFHAAESTGGNACLSPFDLYIDERNVFQPDIMYLSLERLSYITPRGIKGPPDIAVEILSPSNSHNDTGRKKRGYLRLGVSEYWIVDPHRKNIAIFTPTSGEEIPLRIFAGNDEVTSPVFPTLKFRVDTTFPV